METVVTPRAVNIRNPIALEKIAQACAAGQGRNCTEAAANLIIRGFEAMKENATARSSSADKNRKPAPGAA